MKIKTKVPYFGINGKKITVFLLDFYKIYGFYDNFLLNYPTFFKYLRRTLDENYC